MILKKFSLSVLFTALFCSTVFGQQSPAHFPIIGGTGGLTNYTIPTINSRLVAFLDGITTTNDGFGGIFIYNTNDTTTVNSTNVFAPGTGQGGRWQRLLWPGGGGTAPFGPVGGDLSGSLPNPTVAKINGVTLGSTTATDKNILIANGTQWQTEALSGDATIGNSGILTLTSIVGAGTGTKITFDAKGRATAITNSILASADYTNQGTATTVLHGNAAGNPSWSAVSLTADVTGRVPFANVAQIANNSILGNFTGSTADIQVLTSITSANLAQVLSDETGTGVAVFNTAPAFATSISTPLIVTAAGALTLTPASSAAVSVSNALNVGGLITATGSLTYPSATASTATVWDSSKKLISSVTTLAELAFVSGVTSAIQTQINGKVALPIYGTGNPIALAVAGVDGQEYWNTTTGDKWTYLGGASGINNWQP